MKLVLKLYSDKSITVDGKEISFDKTDWPRRPTSCYNFTGWKGNQKRLKNIHNMMIVTMVMVSSDEYYGQEGDYTYDQNEYTEQTNDY